LPQANFIEKSTSKEVLFSGGEDGMIMLCIISARRPKGFAFQYPSSHHYATKQSTGLFCLTLRALSVFESHPNNTHKNKPTKVGLFLWQGRTI